MKTFRFTVPEFPLSNVEKKQHVKSKMEDAPFLSAEGTVTDEGVAFINNYVAKKLHRSQSYFFYFLTQRMLMGFYSVVAYYLLLGVFFALLGGLNLPMLIKLSKQIPFYWLAFVGFSFVWFWKSRREAADLFERLRKRRIEEAEQAVGGNGEQAR